MKARDIMTHDPAALTPADLITVAAAMMRDRNIGFVPIIDDVLSRRLAGVLTDRDIAVRCVATGHGSGCTIGEHMTTGDVRSVRMDAEVHEVVVEMERRHVRRIPVVDENGRLTGLVTQADLAMQLGPAEPPATEEALDRISVPALPIYY